MPTEDLFQGSDQRYVDTPIVPGQFHEALGKAPRPSPLELDLRYLLVGAAALLLYTYYRMK